MDTGDEVPEVDTLFNTYIPLGDIVPARLSNKCLFFNFYFPNSNIQDLCSRIVRKVKKKHLSFLVPSAFQPTAQKLGGYD